MNGPQHFAAAERLLLTVEQPSHDYLMEVTAEGLANDIALAQVHATLALAAATIEASGNTSKWTAVLAPTSTPTLTEGAQGGTGN